MGRGLLQNIFSKGWGAYVCIFLNFPRNEVSFFSTQNQECGDMRKVVGIVMGWGLEAQARGNSLLPCKLVVSQKKRRAVLNKEIYFSSGGKIG